MPPEKLPFISDADFGVEMAVFGGRAFGYIAQKIAPKRPSLRFNALQSLAFFSILFYYKAIFSAMPPLSLMRKVRCIATLQQG
jgi:hypothetical protein